MAKARAYYNEFEPYAAEWLRNLIKSGRVAPGEVDDRSILDVRPDDLAGFTQCHFFAGIAGWSLALRRAGWSDDRPIWTGSAPCQPFSVAGQQQGLADERHLWPAFYELIRVCRPPVIFGEQVASSAVIGSSGKTSKRDATADSPAWIDVVFANLEDADYACGAIVSPSAGVGAPHKRERLYWSAALADTGESEWRWRSGHGQGIRDGAEAGRLENASHAERDRESGVMGDDDDDDDDDERLEGHGRHGADSDEPGWFGALAHGSVAPTGAASLVGNPDEQYAGQHARLWPRQEDSAQAAGPRAVDELEHAASDGWIERRAEPGRRSIERGCGIGELDDGEWSGPANGFWRDADWIFCTDGKWRGVEPGTQPLAHGVPGRVGKLRAYGNAINVEQAKIFIEAVEEALDGL